MDLPTMENPAFQHLGNKEIIMSESIVNFTRRKDYKLIRSLGKGACGETVLLHDPIIESHFVCKKYSPITEKFRAELFPRFIQEIKHLYSIYHKNVVRIYNYYIYPEKTAGYIIMEYIDGEDIEDHLEKNPEKINDIFSQVISGFTHLESINILHRDIRPQNILVNNEGIAKIIDFGFGKKIESNHDFDKSITLNWWCEPPPEFSESFYDFQTEVYFVGKLFEKIIFEHKIKNFDFEETLQAMTIKKREYRFKSFSQVETTMMGSKIDRISFSDEDISTYRTFSHYLEKCISKINNDAKYFGESDRIIENLKSSYNRCMLEEHVKDQTSITRAFINGQYYYNSKVVFPVYALKNFLNMMIGLSGEKRQIVISNIHGTLDGIAKYSHDDLDDEIPF